MNLIKYAICNVQMLNTAVRKLTKLEQNQKETPENKEFGVRFWLKVEMF